MSSCWTLLTAALVAINVGRCLAIICYKCDSINLPGCATSLDSNSLPTEECKSAYSCAMTIVDSVTYRGCITNTPKGPEYYKSCSENLCNKGVYPPGRLKCHQCNGTSCMAAQTSKPTPCLYFKEDDSCYTDVIDETEVYRGCESDTERLPEYMAEFCEINGCNNQPAVTNLTCVKCDSAEGRGCKMDLFEIYSAACNITVRSICSVTSLLGHEEQTCFVYHNLDRVVRGCTLDSGTLLLDKEHFETCDKDMCNKKCLERRKCLVCDSSTEEKCKSDPESLTAVTCESPEASSCNACILADGSIQRGCGAPAATAGAQCYQCDDVGCNSVPFRQCYKCSSADDPNCAQWLNPAAVAVETCEVAGAECISAIDMNGNTLRGCMGPQLACNSSLPTCVDCGGALCNDGIFPPMRLSCFHCDGRAECSDISDKKNLRACAEYTQDDACLEFRTKRGIVRGCKSNQTLFYECLLKGVGCKLCSRSGCNNNPVSRSASLRCHKCSRDDEACSWQLGTESLHICEQSVSFGTLESCFIRRYTDGSTSRGCSLDDGGSSSEELDFLSQICTTDGCNNKTISTQTCKQCQGNTTTENICNTEPEKSESVLCHTKYLAYQRRGCYTWMRGDVVQRGCAVDLEIVELSRCKDSDNCLYCTGMDCNVVVESSEPGSKGDGSKLHGNCISILIIAMILLTS